MLLQLAWKNLWRNSNRTAITMAAIFFAVLLSVITSSLKTGIFDNLEKNLVSFYAGYIQVHKNGYWEEQILDNSFEVAINNEGKILSTPNVESATPRLESFALASTGNITKGCMVIGIDPEKERKITALQNRITQGRFLTASGEGVIVAEGLLKRLKLKLNDTLVLIGQGYHGTTAAGKYIIIGVVRFGTPALNDKTLFMSLFQAQDLYSAENKITSYVIAIKNTANLNSTSVALKNNLNSNFEVMTWGEMMPEIKQHIQTDSNNMQIVQIILYLLVSFGIFGTLLMMIAERRFEMGMLVAIGMKKKALAFLIFMESILTVLAGCFLGILASIPIVYYLHAYPIRIAGKAAEAYERFGFEPIFPTSLHPNNFISQGIIVCIIGFCLSLYPVYRVLRLNPVEAMRR